ncbi:MAG: hypothetical protein ACREPG_10795 [Candidatus Binatia bacterium]
MSATTNKELAGYPLLDALIKRRSRRFGLGMKMDGGPLAHHSRHAPLSLTEEEEAATAYCEYIYQRYGRFLAYLPPFRTVLGFQACHVDLEFYDRYYRAEALSETERGHTENWHGKEI